MALRCSPCSREGWSVVAILSGNNFLMHLERSQEFAEARNISISLQVTNEKAPSTVSHAFLRSRKTRKRGSWSTLASYWVGFSYMVAVTIPLLAWNPWRKLWKWIPTSRWVSTIASTTFQRISRRPMYQVSMEPLGISTNIFHTNSWGISPVRHMFWTTTKSYEHLLHQFALMIFWLCFCLTAKISTYFIKLM